jgi:penicillin-binding protein 1B
VGAAAWAYFGKEASRLDLCESAVLAGMISSPGNYSPVSQPQRSHERRDWVLGRMAELGWLDESGLAAELERPLCSAPQPIGTRRAAYFGDRAAAEAERRFGVRGLADSGYVLLSTLDARDQRMAEEMVGWGVESLEQGWEKERKAAGPLQAALVSLEPDTGAIRAYVGGRDYGASQFDRVGRALRQAGSAFKPVVYAAAFEDRVAAPASMLEDAPLTVRLAGGREWTPRNSNSEFRGWVSVRTALEDSLNVPTARLALQVGLDRVVELARAMGVSSRLQPVPALALGAFEVTPLELTSVYAVLASGGVRHEPWGLRAVLDPAGEVLEGEPRPEPQQVLSPQTVFLVTSLLQGVLDRGTAASVRAQGLRDPLAGKTGTTNDRRDSWFAGYSPDRVTLVWVGYDDNSPTRLSGARAALPVWARFTWKVRPPGGYPLFPQPAGIATAVIDPESGQLATDDCTQVLTEVYLEGTVPTELCPLHGAWRRERAWRTTSVEKPQKHRPWRWLRKLFGKGDRAAEQEPERPEPPPESGPPPRGLR